MALLLIPSLLADPGLASWQSISHPPFPSSHLPFPISHSEMIEAQTITPMSAWVGVAANRSPTGKMRKETLRIKGSDPTAQPIDSLGQTPSPQEFVRGAKYEPSAALLNRLEK